MRFSSSRAVKIAIGVGSARTVLPTLVGLARALGSSASREVLVRPVSSSHRGSNAFTMRRTGLLLQLAVDVVDVVVVEAVVATSLMMAVRVHRAVMKSSMRSSRRMRVR